MTFIPILYIFFLALTLAFLEVQIEGEHGWARQLPCWRPHNSKWFARLYARVMCGKEMTGYHLAVFSFSFLVLHLPYVWGLPWDIGSEFCTLSVFFMFVVVWDFLWFVINPHYGIKKFCSGRVPWHRVWLLGLPVDYYGGIILSFVFYYLYSAGGYMDWLAMFGRFGILLVVTVAVVDVINRIKKK